MSDMSNIPSPAELESAASTVDQNLDVLSGVRLRMSVEVGSASLTLSDLLGLSKGSVVELDRDCNAMLDIFANGTLIARGEIVSVDGRYGIRVSEIVERRSGSIVGSGDGRSAERRSS